MTPVEHFPDWRPGDPVVSPVGEMVSIDFAGLGSTPIYKLLTSAIVPRPIALVSTVNEAGVVNLAPFSFFNGVSSDPACLLFSVTRKPDGSKKDTLLNIEKNGQFVVNSVAEWMAEPMNYCSGEYPYGVSELEKTGFTSVPALMVRPPRVKESPIHFECEVYHCVEVGEGRLGSSTVVIGRILMMHIDARAYENGKIKFAEIAPLARLGGFNYGLTSGVFAIPRPKNI